MKFSSDTQQLSLFLIIQTFGYIIILQWGLNNISLFYYANLSDTWKVKTNTKRLAAQSLFIISILWIYYYLYNKTWEVSLFYCINLHSETWEVSLFHYANLSDKMQINTKCLTAKSLFIISILWIYYHLHHETWEVSLFYCVIL